MPPEDGDKRKPPRGLNLAERHIQKHLPDTPQMLKLLKEDGKAHVFNDVKLSSWKFIEMWVDPSSDLPYVLMLVGDVDGSYTLYDPTEGYQVVYAARDYEKVKDFLLEDEYVQIRGRYQENAEVRKSEPVFV